MMERSHLILAGFLSAALILAGCGVSQADADQSASDLAAAQAEIVKLQSDLAAANEQIRSLQADLDDVQADYDTCQATLVEWESDFTSYQTDCEALQTLVDQTTQEITDAAIYKDILVELLLPTITGDGLTEAGKIEVATTLADESGDAELQAKVAAWAANPGSQELASEILGYALLQLEQRIFQ